MDVLTGFDFRLFGEGSRSLFFIDLLRKILLVDVHIIVPFEFEGRLFIGAAVDRGDHLFQQSKGILLLHRPGRKKAVVIVESQHAAGDGGADMARKAGLGEVTYSGIVFLFEI